MSQPEAQAFLQEINWGTLLPAAIDLFRHIQQGNFITDFERTLAILKEILSALQKAEIASQGLIDWKVFLPQLLKFLIPILIGLGAEEEPGLVV